MKDSITLRVVLQNPNEGVWFGLQKGSGNNYEVIQRQESTDADMRFEFDIALRTGKDSEIDFAGPLVQGPRGGRFIYIDIGTYAGQHFNEWGRRLKIPLIGISAETINEMEKKAGLLETLIPGKGKDGGPNCATVKPFDGWKLAKR